MTLKELSQCYKDASEPLRQRLRELREQMSRTDDPEEIWHLKRRIADLTPMLTQMNELAWMLEHYYERGGADRDERYGFCGKRKAKKNQRKADENLAPNFARRIKRLAASDLFGLSLRDEDPCTDRPGSRGEQKHYLPDTETGGTEGAALHEVLQDVSDFFSPNPKKNRRIT